EEIDVNEDPDRRQNARKRHDEQARRSSARLSSETTTPRIGRRSVAPFVNNATGGSRERLRQRNCDRAGSGGRRVILAAATFDRLRDQQDQPRYLALRRILDWPAGARAWRTHPAPCP